MSRDYRVFVRVWSEKKGMTKDEAEKVESVFVKEGFDVDLYDLEKFGGEITADSENTNLGGGMSCEEYAEEVAAKLFAYVGRRLCVEWSWWMHDRDPDATQMYEE